MTESNKTRFHSISVAAIASVLLLVFALASGCATEGNQGGVEATGKKVERGFGELLKGIGQEVGKTVNPDAKKETEKKDDAKK